MKLNLLHIQQLIKIINNSPYFQSLSMIIEYIGIGYSVVKIDVELQSS